MKRFFLFFILFSHAVTAGEPTYSPQNVKDTLQNIFLMDHTALGSQDTFDSFPKTLALLLLDEIKERWTKEGLGPLPLEFSSIETRTILTPDPSFYPHRFIESLTRVLGEFKEAQHKVKESGICNDIQRIVGISGVCESGAADGYKLFGVNQNASLGEIRKAYINLSRQHHPDKGGDLEKFQILNGYNEIFKDPVKRARYDQIYNSPDFHLAAQALNLKSFPEDARRLIEENEPLFQGFDFVKNNDKEGLIRQFFNLLHNPEVKWNGEYADVNKRTGVFLTLLKELSNPISQNEVKANPNRLREEILHFILQNQDHPTIENVKKNAEIRQGFEETRDTYINQIESQPILNHFFEELTQEGREGGQLMADAAKIHQAINVLNKLRSDLQANSVDAFNDIVSKVPQNELENLKTLYKAYLKHPNVVSRFILTSPTVNSALLIQDPDLESIKDTLKNNQEILDRVFMGKLSTRQAVHDMKQADNTYWNTFLSYIPFSGRKEKLARRTKALDLLEGKLNKSLSSRVGQGEYNLTQSDQTHIDTNVEKMSLRDFIHAYSAFEQAPFTSYAMDVEDPQEEIIHLDSSEDNEMGGGIQDTGSNIDNKVLQNLMRHLFAHGLIPLWNTFFPREPLPLATKVESEIDGGLDQALDIYTHILDQYASYLKTLPTQNLSNQQKENLDTFVQVMDRLSVVLKTTIQEQPKFIADFVNVMTNNPNNAGMLLQQFIDRVYQASEQSSLQDIWSEGGGIHYSANSVPVTFDDPIQEADQAFVDEEMPDLDPSGEESAIANDSNTSDQNVNGSNLDASDSNDAAMDIDEEADFLDRLLAKRTTTGRISDQEKQDILTRLRAIAAARGIDISPLKNFGKIEKIRDFVRMHLR